MIALTVERFGRLDVLFNNAFSTTFGPVGEMTLDGWQKTLSVTLSAVFYGMHFALPQMVSQGGRRDCQYRFDFRSRRRLRSGRLQRCESRGSQPDSHRRD
jgi:NAD(P)-dependent dehydrogenase (short-subunit alcohol dehydrogenase family)